MRKQVIHFDSPEARLAYLKGEYEEIIPVEVKEEPKEKPKNATKKKGKKKDEVQTQ